MKACSKCKIEKEKFEFSKCKSTKDGLNNWCKKCHKNYSVENKDKNKEYHKNYRINNKVLISEKNKEYYINNKDKILEYQKEYHINNEDKILEYYKNYRINNKDKILEYHKNYRINNKDKISKYHKNYYDDNKYKILNRIKKYKKKRRLIDYSFKLRTYISSNICNALKKQNSSKFGQSIIRYLPYTINELKQHIESKFEYWMNWENHGQISNNKRTWQIDHIIPQSLLPYISMEEENFQKCWALKNLRPMEAFANIKKGNKI
jgi:hypothetical protein